MGGKIRMYLPTAHPVHEWKKRITESCAEAYGSSEMVKGPVTLEMTFVFQKPKSRKVSGLKDTKPDLDNLMKACMEAMGQSGIWEDDKQVASVISSKRWAEDFESPRIMVVLSK
jgi:Holliday junction resolvase RusA-like endonuclease